MSGDIGLHSADAVAASLSLSISFLAFVEPHLGDIGVDRGSRLGLLAQPISSLKSWGRQSICTGGLPLLG